MKVADNEFEAAVLETTKCCAGTQKQNTTFEVTFWYKSPFKATDFRYVT